MFSIGRQIYEFNYDVNYCEIINLYQVRIKQNTITKKLIQQIENNFDYKMKIKYDIYVVFKNGFDDVIVFNGNIVRMQIFDDDFCIDNFTYVRGKYFVFSLLDDMRILVNEIETGRNVISKLVPFSYFDIIQSPDGNYLFLWIIYDHEGSGNYVIFGELHNYVIPTETFIDLLLNNFDSDVLEKYKIDVCANGNIGWITNDVISNAIDQKHCIQIYDILTKRTIDIFDPDFNYTNIPIFVKGAYYIFLKTKIVIAKNDSIRRIPNKYRLMEYNSAFDLFINLDYELYKYFDDVGDFVRFMFIGEYKQDYNALPQDIQTVLDCLLECDLIYDIVNEIYRQLLNLDPINVIH